MNYQLKADKLTVKNTKGNNQSYSYLAPLNLAEESGLGQLFIIAEIRSKEKKVPAILEQIVQELSEYYYHSPTKNAEAALETTCQYFNENIADISQKNWQWLKEKISTIIATVQDDCLSLSNYNNIKIWLVREGKVHDISGADNNGKKTAAAKKILSQIITGQLENNDILLLSNATIFNYFSEEKIKKTITTLAPTQACAFLKNTLLDYKVTADFSTIIVKFVSYKKNEREAMETAHINILQNAEMEDRLNQKGGWRLTGLVKDALSKIKISLGSKTERAKTAITKNVLAKIKKNQDKTQQRKTATDWRSKLGFSGSQTAVPTNWLKKLRLREYRLIIFIIIVAIIFAGSLKIIGDKKTERAQSQKIETAIADLKDKLNSVEAAMIYKDEAKAEQLLAEAKNLLANFTYKQNNSGADYEQLVKQAAEMTNKVYKLERIKNEGYFSKLPETVVPTGNLVWSDNFLYFVSGATAYKINGNDGVVNQAVALSGPINKIMAPDNKQLIFYGNGNEIFFWNKKQTTVQKKILTIPDNDKAVDAAIYSQKFYLLGEKNIYNYNYSNGDYGNGVKWLKEETSIAGNTAIAVDGNVWLSAAGGEINRLFKGKKEKFTLSGLYEPISQATIIYAKDGLNNLYLLDKEKNRITVANKQGKVTRQILGDNLDKIVALAPSDNEKELYILTAKGVYKFGL
ncbi:hypothetical protein A2V95_02270 [Candidatus Kuenenbacteria bacterium RBG_16_41_7]|uniref:Uncharacterized protein n=1 Tax=Candidatus Kuenenbacteria bacterium RBG_16_41_7 TaxID=1798560 RepID=A0A1F6GDG5_9BACT|nr:MAG: hypothetical protein A2V95_02270 [Candidatus Kuenenbacteria bacterium RBG_16_41_7]